MFWKGERDMKIIFVRHGHPDYEKDCFCFIAFAVRCADEAIVVDNVICRGNVPYHALGGERLAAIA